MAAALESTGGNARTSSYLLVCGLLSKGGRIGSTAPYTRGTVARQIINDLIGVAGMAILANLLWYRSFWSLRPQLGIFNRAAQELR
jgi:hypothetical protein